MITGSTITKVVEGEVNAPGVEVLDAEGAYVSPGFINIHVHGGDGHDFMDGTEEAFLQIPKPTPTIALRR